MKQRISAIILLFSFIGILVHDMIPHHHEQHGISEVNIQQEDHHNCDASELDVSLNSNCSSSGDEFSDNNHECPHHIHNCTLHVYDAGRSLPTGKSQKVSLAHDFNQPDNNSIFYISSEKIQFPPKLAYLFRNTYLSNIALRAPPAIG